MWSVDSDMVLRASFGYKKTKGAASSLGIVSKFVAASFYKLKSVKMAAQISLPPRGRGTAAGFPETNKMSFGGSRVSGGRSLRDFIMHAHHIVARAPSVA